MSQEILSKILTDKDIGEEYIKSLWQLVKDEDVKKCIYQIIGDLNNGLEPDEILSNLKSGEKLWEHKVYHNIRDRITEQDNFLINPFEVEDGVLECNCGSKRVFSYSKQVRSCDEGTSVFANCMECKASWVHSG